jgi:hypothetical protein
MTTLRDAALAYAAAGYEVFPLRGKLPHANCPAWEARSPRYHPYHAADCAHALCHGLYAATSDPARVGRWWDRWPAANIGARVPRTLLVLDVDPRHGGDRRLAKLQARHGPLPPTRVSLSGRGDGGGELGVGPAPGEQRLLQGGRHQGGLLGARDPPSEDAPGVGVGDERDVHKPGQGPHVGEVATHHWSGRLGVSQARWMRSGWRGARSSRRVVIVRCCPPITPAMPTMPIRRATWSRPRFQPARRIRCHSLRTP